MRVAGGTKEEGKCGGGRRIRSDVCVYAAVKAIAQGCSSLSLFFIRVLLSFGTCQVLVRPASGCSTGWKEQDLLQPQAMNSTPCAIWASVAVSLHRSRDIVEAVMVTNTGWNDYQSLGQVRCVCMYSAAEYTRVVEIINRYFGVDFEHFSLLYFLFKIKELIR
jgi:hypothetical protein